ncbi:MAG: SMP-30/gluconolactonase/LRE family protein [Phycisphaerales bacterium]|nr:SMP-30/gluconolactonase/LRE family protein [Phycisphaerales bacterium]
MTLTAALFLAATLGLTQPRTAPASQPDAPKADRAADPAWPFTEDKPTEIAKGYKFTEGPTWVPSGESKDGKRPGFFVFCDMAGDTVYRWDGGKEAPAELRKPSGNAVGSAADKKGTIYQVETEGRVVSSWSVESGKPSRRTEAAGKFESKPLGGMNDVAVHDNGSVYVTHGNWFIGKEPTPFQGVLRISPDGKTSKVAEGLSGPNGICFSPDGKTAYVTEYGAAKINAYPVKEDGSFGDRKLFADLTQMAGKQGVKARGGADGIRTDGRGNIYSTGPGGIWVLNPKGEFIAHLPTRATNLAFGGDDGKTLLITTGGGVSRIGVKNAGAGW